MKVKYYVESKIELQRQEIGRISEGSYHQNLIVVCSNRINEFHELFQVPIIDLSI